MAWFLPTALTGAIAFAATNVDDLFVLMLFFSQVDAGCTKSQIYVGQYLGFAAVILCSLPGFFGGILIPPAWIGVLGLVPIALGVRALFHREEDDEIQSATLPNNAISKFLLKFFRPKTLSVAIVTFANGGDNIATYIPLFASFDLDQLIVVLAVFFSAIAVWCAIANRLASHPAIAPVLAQYNSILVPIVLIGLGLYILLENETWRIVS